MLPTSALAELGPEGLAMLLDLRPEALDPVPPRSLQELAARLVHRSQLMAAMERFDLPTAQVAEALAGLGDRSDRDRLLTLLGASTPSDVQAVDRALMILRAHLFVVSAGDGEPRLLPEVREVFGQPLGLGPGVETLAAQHTVEQLRRILSALGASPTAEQPQRKADLLRCLVAVLGDPDRVRRILAQAPRALVQQLLDVAHGRRELVHYGWAPAYRTGVQDVARDPVVWALERFLLVRSEWDARLTMPAEVALALRGPDWSAAFDPVEPLIEWAPRAADAVTRAGAAAAGEALRTVGALLELAGDTPFALLKSGAVGVRELRRAAVAVGCDVREVRLTLGLGHALELIDTADDVAAPTTGFDTWRGRPAPERYDELVFAWRVLLAHTFVSPTAAWAPEGNASAVTLRHLVLELLADHPDAASDPESITAAARWRAPLLMDNLGDVDSTVAVRAVLQEATWLGLVGDDAITPVGSAALRRGDVSELVADALGAARTTARLQADLTAVVLGEPAPDLAAFLDETADRENRSTAAVWRFSPASVRRALDAGSDAETLLRLLAEVSDGGVPQPLEYLVRDVARRHGALRGGQVSCYLRSDDEALLTEIVADRKLRALGLRRVAPTVAVGVRPLSQTLEALRAAGHAPVEEGPDGATVVARRQRHRIVQVPASDDGGEPLPGAASSASVAAALIADPGRPSRTLMDIGSTVVELQALTSRESMEALW